MQMLYEDDGIEISFEPGNNATAIVSFSGIGMKMGGVQIEEFKKSLAGTDNSVYYVKDKDRHWYNSSFDRIGDVINEDFAKRNIGRVLTLGNSMGGFGAIAFAKVLKGCQAAIAFSAQSAIDPSVVPWDRRYRKFTDSVSQWVGLDAAKMLVPHVNYKLFYGDVSNFDTRHAQRMANADHANLSVYVMAGAGHGVAGFLKRKGVLHPLVQALIADGGQDFDASTILQSLNYKTLQPAPGVSARRAQRPARLGIRSAI